jgi:plastocyanin
MDFPDKYPIKTNNTLKFKVYCSQQGRIFAKFWNNGNVLIESWAPEWNFKPEPNKWVQCEMDMTPAMNKEFDILQIAACVDNDEVAEVYFDDFELSNPDIGDGSPKVSFTVSKTRIQTGEMVSFDASTSFDYDGTINQYNWDFGDGSTGTGKTTEHAYSNAGTYTATLTCIDNDKKAAANRPIFLQWMPRAN